MPRRGNIRALERKLGFYTERGLHRSGNSALTPAITHMLEVMDEIKRDYIGLGEHQLLSSESFEKAWRDPFWDLGPQLWPEVSSDSEASTDPEFYPRPLVFLEPADRRILERGFSQLVLQKCLTYQQNQAAKRQRDSKAAEARHRKDGDYMPGTEYDDPTPRASFRSPSEQSATPSVSSDDNFDELYECDRTYANGNKDKSAEDAMLQSVMGHSGCQSVPSHEKRFVLVRDTIDPSNLTKRRRQESDDDDGGRPMKRPYYENGTSQSPLTTEDNIGRSDTEQTATDEATLAHGFRPINKDADAPSLKPLKSSRPPGTTACAPCSSRKVRCDGTRSKCHFRVGYDAEDVSGKTPSTESAGTRKKLTIKLAVPRASSGIQTPLIMTEKMMNDVVGPDDLSDQIVARRNNLAAQPPAAPVEPVSSTDVTGGNGDEMNEEVHVSAEKHQGRPSKAVDPVNERSLRDEHLQQSFTEPPTVTQDGIIGHSTPKRLSTHQHEPASAPEQASTPETARIPSLPSTSAIAGQRESTTDAGIAAPCDSSRRSEGASHSIENGDKTQGATTLSAQSPDQPIVTSTSTRQEFVQSWQDHLAALRIGLEAEGIIDANGELASRLDKLLDGRSAPGSLHGRHRPTVSSSHSVSSNRQDTEPAQSSAATPGPRLATESTLDDAIQARPRSPADVSRSIGAVELPRQDRLTTEGTAPTSNNPPEATINRNSDVPEQTSAASLPPQTPTISTSTALHTPIDAKGPFASAETSSFKTELMSGIRASSTTPSTLEDSKPAVGTPTPSAGTGMIVLVDWIHRHGTSDTVSRLTRYKRNLWDAVKVDMPASFQSTKLAGIKPSMVRMSAGDVLEQYGESIASEGLEDCVQFLMDEAFGEEGDVERTWRKATVMMKD